MRWQVESLLKHPAWDMKTLKSANHANLEHDPIAVVRDRCPNQRAAHEMPPCLPANLIQGSLSYGGTQKMHFKNAAIGL
jgi:hypothetical protein